MTHPPTPSIRGIRTIPLKKSPYSKKSLTKHLFLSEKYYFCIVFNNKKKLFK